MRRMLGWCAAAALLALALGLTAAHVAPGPGSGAFVLAAAGELRRVAFLVPSLPDGPVAVNTADAEELGETVRGLLRRSGQPATLRAWGVRREDLPHMARLGMTRGRADNNPVPIDPATILSILEQIYDPTDTYSTKQKGA